ncbi:ABC-type transport system ATP-binding protein (probable substrate zinc/manganese/metal ions) [Natrialba magadii ATCC 43099]|uniref:Cobalamin import ATP-binding protein BtuD n=1 Tax=Natrialba magadii (strain ATCC 43099 / DSM 3394 / CCM 3739 / CIP 104546 / IAM 13178 / JCM 8861 / NBRC 102185 / NCIMB 2190 / MS3) TaxID=547559 RepID=D3SQR0_NATMM|nr:metal ABC transporter ATP-binding protein [Natrialba magadii]ADD04548.1 ABC-type transport system ATP-binding protein (probable substrate zinc/manganese/metal ions) [Natrialba magadii ATCC 43099]ELY25205.1 ABC transporter [Natrialba magadii ATCC 43099]
MSAVIHAENVSFAYDDQVVVDDITLSVTEGDFLGLIGPNGSGKTTLLKIMLGLRQPDTGSVELFGTPASEFTDGTRLGYVSQQSSEADSMMPVTVREVVEMGRYPHVGVRRLSEADQKIIDDALAKVEISDLADRRISRLSGGQKQRAYIARALASEADLLALDEPTVGVDAESVDQFYTLLDELNRSGITIVLIEHDLGIVTEHADMMACLDCELYEHCETAEFLESDALERAYSSARVLKSAGFATGD